MSFFDEVKKNSETRQREKERKEAIIANYREEIREKKQELEAAKLAGDYKKYTAIEYEIKELNNAILFAQNIKSQNDEKSDIAGKWAKYTEEYKKAFNKANNEYMKALREAAEAFKTLISVQNEGLKQRRAYVDYVGGDPSEDLQRVSYEMKKTGHDVQFFGLYDLLTPDEVTTIEFIINGVPHETLHEVKSTWLEDILRESPRKHSVYDVINEHRAIIAKVRKGKLPLSAIDWLQDYSGDLLKQVYVDMFQEDYAEVMRRNSVNYA